MPTYKVKARGFFDGKLYDPEGKRQTLTTDKPFTQKNKIDEQKAQEDKNDIAAASSVTAVDENDDPKGESFLNVMKGAIGMGDKPTDDKPTDNNTVETI